MRQRDLGKTNQRAARTFPALVITGPRQSGKTTLVPALFSGSHEYLSLEDPDIRRLAVAEPRAFFSIHPPPLALDEIQYFPELLPYVKTSIDRDRRPGRWILTGSQNFTLMAGVTESLAGRAANCFHTPGTSGDQPDDPSSQPSAACFRRFRRISRQFEMKVRTRAARPR